MKKIVGLLVLALVVFVAVYRQRIFLWDPLASVDRDGVKQGGVRVMINYSNDVLVEDKSGKARRLYLVQHWNETPEFSTGTLKCMEWLACMTDADHAPGEMLPGGGGGVTMTDRTVEFRDENGARMRVTLR